MICFFYYANILKHILYAWYSPMCFAHTNLLKQKYKEGTIIILEFKTKTNKEKYVSETQRS